MKKHEIKKEILLPEGEPQVFKIDEHAINRQRDRLELTYLTAQLKDPDSVVSRIVHEEPGKETEEVLRTMRERKIELTKKIIDDLKSRLSGKKPITLPRPLPRRSGEFSLAMRSIEDILRRMGPFPVPRPRKPLEDRPCETREGTVYEPISFTKTIYSHLERGSSGAMGIGYHLDDGVLPFEGFLDDAGGEMDSYTILGELGYEFPSPHCDSRLTWEFKLGAGAGFYCGADEGILWLDYRFYEQSDASQQPPGIPLMLGGDLLEINETVAWHGITPITVSGTFDVTAETVSRLWAALCVTIWVRDGLAETEGFFQLYAGEWGGFSPGVNYRLDPI